MLGYPPGHVHKLIDKSPDEDTAKDSPDSDEKQGLSKMEN